MNMIVYSKTTNAFYLVEHKSNYQSTGVWPDDVVDITPDIFREFSGAPPAGKIRIAGPNGLPAWGDIPPPTPVQLQQQAESQKRYRVSQATNAIAPLQYAVDLKMATDRERATLTEWKKYCVLLNRVDCSSAPDIDWPNAPEL